MQRLGRVAAAVLQAQCSADLLALQQAAPALQRFSGCLGSVSQHNLCTRTTSSSSWFTSSTQHLLDQQQQQQHSSNSHLSSLISNSSSTLQHSSRAFTASSSSSKGSTQHQSSPLSASVPTLDDPPVLSGTKKAAAAASPAPAAPAAPAPAAADATKKGPIEGICKRKNIKLGWKKLDFVLRMVRRSYVDDAMAQLSANPKKAAKFAMHAIANARNNAICAGGDPAKLWVAEAFATKGKYTKKLAIMGRGYSGVKESRKSHLNVKVRQIEEGDQATAKVLQRLRRPPKMIAPLMVRQQQRQQRLGLS